MNQDYAYSELSRRRSTKIALLWLSLMPGWILMALEAPIIVAWLGNQSNEVEALAAFGIFYSFALVLETPVIMLLTTATRLNNGPVSFASVHRFSVGVILIATAVAGLLTYLPQANLSILGAGYGVSGPILEITSAMLLTLIVWPASVGYRRTLQGLLITNQRSKTIYKAAMFRLLGTITGLTIGSVVEHSPALYAAVALVMGSVFETTYTALKVYFDGLIRSNPHLSNDEPISLPDFLNTYLPLTSSGATYLILPAVITVILARSNDAQLALAVFPLVHGFGFLFRTVGLAMQEVLIICFKGDDLDKKAGHQLYVAAFWLLGMVLAIIGLTPIAAYIFGNIMNIDASLTELAARTFIFALPFPVLTLIINRERAICITENKSRAIFVSSVFELFLVVTVVFALIAYFGVPGAIAAVSALNVGRLASIAFLRSYHHFDKGV